MSAPDLARRWAALVADGRARWLPGMRGRLPDGQHHSWSRCEAPDEDEPYLFGANDDAVPDFDDPATKGCLLALVRLAWGPDASIYEMHGGAGSGSLVISASYQVMFKAVGGELSGRRLAALEAAPKGAK